MMTDQILFDITTSTKDDAFENLKSVASPSNSSDNSSDSLNTINNIKHVDIGNKHEFVIRSKKRIKTISETSSDEEEVRKRFNCVPDDDHKNSEHEDESRQIKPRNRIIFNNDEDELETDVKSTTENNESRRIHSKKKKLREKFCNLKFKQEKYSGMEMHNKKKNFESNNSEEDLYSCNKIKQIIRENQTARLSVICDPDSSESEDNEPKKQRKAIMKSTKLVPPKPVRMSAKQAMENMHKIKSESNRMLREKAVSLPYHKPKALSLKDVMSRRKPALAPDGKALSVKMTTEQLEEYALHLEQRQKEMMELCKSDSDDYSENEKDRDTKDIEERIDIYSQEENRASKINENVNIETNTHANYIYIAEVTNNVCNENNKLADCTANENSEVFKNDQNIGSVNTFKKIQDTESFSDEGHKNQKDEDNALDNTNTNCGDIFTVSTDNKEDSQIIELHYNSEKNDNANTDELNNIEIMKDSYISFNDKKAVEVNDVDDINKLFLENDISFDEIDKLVKQFDHKGDNANKIGNSLNIKPKLTGAPGMIIDLDNSTITEKKLSGVELLKERFKYFAKLKSKDEENDREKKYKPGLQHLKLKQELEQQIAEQRSLEWAKRLEQESQQQLEFNAIQENESDTDDIEKIEAKLQKIEESHISNDESEDTAEEEEICEDDCVIEDKPRTKNPMIDDEAEESEMEDDIPKDEQNDIDKEDCTENNSDFDESDGDSNDDESSESDEELNSNPRKGRILKAFEDSDEEENENENSENKQGNDDNPEISSHDEHVEKDENINGTQDEELQLAQVHKTTEDIMVTQNQTNLVDPVNIEKGVEFNNKDLGSQTFSIRNSQNGVKCLNQLVQEVGRFEDNFKSQNLYMDYSQNSQDINSLTESQELGADVAALCTGKFYDNPFVSQVEDGSQLGDNVNCIEDITSNNAANSKNTVQASQSVRSEEKILSSILEELDNPQLESPNQYRYFVNDSNFTNKENVKSNENISVKKKFAIDSDDEMDAENNVKNIKKKLKKRKLEKRALQFSDEEDFEARDEEQETFESDIEEDNERLVEYDSEENEVEIQPLKVKKKRVAGDFLEQEAELTSEDEWIGSGDEDEAGLDRMEREEGDDEVFHEGKLRNELGQIHMRDVLDQDKREVRLLQELLFEDGDLGDGHRQRKFRWKNADDIEDGGSVVDEFADTQEEEFESEEQWRKQRHEREVFLRKMKGNNDEDINNCTINRSTIIKANLCSKTTSSLISEPNVTTSDNTQKKNTINDKKNKDIPSPKKHFPKFQQSHHGSLLSRGKNALARLAAIATPIAGDGDSTTKVSAPTNRRNFVFAALSQNNDETKAPKRKADTTAPSPVLTKKMKIKEKPKYLKSSLFDFLET